MDLQPVALLLLCVGLSVQHRDLGAAVLRSVRAGASVTLPCDLKNKIFTTWYQQSFNSNQAAKEFSGRNLLHKPIPGISFQFNRSASSFSLKIMNFSDPYLGFYYCATKYQNVYYDKDGKILSEERYQYSNITIKLVYAGCGQCCLLLVTVCPLTALLSALLSAGCVYSCCHRKGSTESINQQREDRRGLDQSEEGEVNYAMLEIRKGRKEHKRPKNRPTQSADSCLYSDINTARVY